VTLASTVFILTAADFVIIPKDGGASGWGCEWKNPTVVIFAGAAFAVAERVAAGQSPPPTRLA